MAAPVRFADRRQENLQRLAAVETDERRANADAYREASMQQRAEAAAQRAMQAEGRLGIAQENLALEKQKAELDAKTKESQRLMNEAALAAANAKADRTNLIASQGAAFLKDAIGMDPASPKFDIQFQQMQAGYPHAAELPAVKEWLDYHVPLRKGFIEREAKQAEEKAIRDAALVAAQDLPVKRVVVDGVTHEAPDPTKPLKEPNLGTTRTTTKDKDGNSVTTVVPIQPSPKALLSAVPGSTVGAAAGLDAGKNAPPPSRIVVNPKTGERLQLKDGKWQPLTQ